MVTSRTRSAATSDTLAHRSEATATNAASRSPFGVPSRAGAPGHLVGGRPSERGGLAPSPPAAFVVAPGVPEAGGPEAGGILDPGGPGVPTHGPEVPGDGRDRGPGLEPGFRVGVNGVSEGRGPGPRPVQPFGEAPQLGRALAARGRREAAHLIGNGPGAPGRFAGSPKCERSGGAD